jgi:ATP-binding cassette, subfamily B, bacterial PglK
MYKLFKDIFRLLSRRDRFTFLVLIVFLFFTTIFEILGLALILPFLLLINNLELIETNEFIQSLFTFTGLESNLDFLYFIGFLAISCSFIGMVLAIYTNLKLVKYSNNIGASFSVRLFKLFFRKINREELSNREIYNNIRKKVISEAMISSNNIVLPLINIISRLVLIILFLIILVSFNYKLTLLIISFFIIFYFIILKFSKKIININISKIEKYKIEKEELFQETFNAVNENFRKNDKNCIEKYKISNYKLVKAQSINGVISKLPRYIMMFLVFSSIVAFLMHLVSIDKDSISSIMHTILIFLVIGLKILPQLQNIYINYMKIQSNKLAFYNVYNELNKKE